MERHASNILGQAKQSLLSYVLSLFLVAIFLILWMLRKKGVTAIEVELVLLPLIIDSLQSIALQNLQRRSPLLRFLKVTPYIH